MDIFFAVFEFDQGCCFHCGKQTNLEMHHLVPKSSGGRDVIGNCIMVCGPRWIGSSCHFKIHEGSEEHKIYLCDDDRFTNWLKLQKIHRERVRRMKKRLAMQLL